MDKQGAVGRGIYDNGDELAPVLRGFRQVGIGLGQRREEISFRPGSTSRTMSKRSPFGMGSRCRSLMPTDSPSESG